MAEIILKREAILLLIEEWIWDIKWIMCNIKFFNIFLLYVFNHWSTSELT